MIVHGLSDLLRSGRDTRQVNIPFTPYWLIVYADHIKVVPLTHRTVRACRGETTLGDHLRSDRGNMYDCQCVVVSFRTST